MQLHDLTLHPVAPGFVEDVLRRWVAEPPRGMGVELSDRLDRARLALGGGESAGLPLELALGTALAHYEVYWLERSCGLRWLCRDEPAILSLLRHPFELLTLAFPGAARLGMGEQSVWVPGESIHPLRQALRCCAGELRESLEAAGIGTYLAALVEATGYCLDRGYGLLELKGVADLLHLPNRSCCRAFFDRAAAAPGAGAAAAEPLPAEPEPVAALLSQAEEALEDGETERARRLLRELRERNEDGGEQRLLGCWLLLHDGDPWTAAELLEGIDERALAPELGARYVALRGWALLGCGAPDEALPFLARAIELLPDSHGDVERFALAAIQGGARLGEALAAVKSHLQRLTPPAFRAETEYHWLSEAEEDELLSEPERFAALLALCGRIHAAQGFVEHAEHELDQALLLDADLPWARRWLKELREEHD